jgi:hypothetical protein
VIGWLLVVATAAAMPAAQAEGTRVQVSAEVAPGVFKSVRLLNAPRDGQLAIAIQASSRVLVSLLNEEDAKRFPQAEQPLFSAPVERSLSFATTLSVGGTYYIMLDNRRGEMPSRVSVSIRSEAPTEGRAAVPGAATPAPESVQPRPSRLRRVPQTHDM